MGCCGRGALTPRDARTAVALLVARGRDAHKVRGDVTSRPPHPAHLAGARAISRVAAAIFAIALLLFALLAFSAPEGDYLPLEHRLMAALRHDGRPIGPAWMEGAVRDLTALGSFAVVGLLVALILGYLCLRRYYRVAVLLTAACAGGAVLNEVLKNAFHRARPDAALRLIAIESLSFPSGHAMASSIFYLTIGLLVSRLAHRRLEKAYLIGTAILLTAVTGLSRVYLGVHYPTDVLAGWAAGTAWALLCFFIADALARRGALRRRPASEPASPAGD